MEEKRFESDEFGTSSTTSRWLVVAVVVLLAVAAIAFGYGYVEQQSVRQIAAQNDQTSATIGQLRSQVDTLTAKLTAMSTPPPAPEQAAANQPAASGGKAGAKRASTRRRSAEDRRLKEIQAKLAEHQKQLDETQQAVQTTRSELEGQLSSTKDELNGSIARTHDELVALQKRGERNYIEFDLNKSNNFQRVGPISVELRKTDTKHQHFNLMLLVDDFRLTKKNVNLYEPVWIHETDYPQPLQLVVNKIDKNHVHGYVSSPKYRQSELVTVSAPATPANPQPPDQPANPNPDQTANPRPQPDEQQPMW